MPSIAIPLSLRGQLLNSVRAVAPFSPTSLFAANEPGVWYDPSDLTTLFQDTAGTTPVTTPGQTVALALDKSKGLVLGSELVSNPGPFTFTTGWTGGNGATVSVSGGNLRVTSNGSNTSPRAYVAISTVIGTTYKLTTSVSQVSGTFVTAPFLTKSDNTAWSTNALYAINVFTATATTTYVGIQAVSAVSSVVVFDIASFSVKELPGFHATQATTASRPIYGINPVGGRRNLLTWSEEFENAAWTKNATSSISVNSALAPNGTLTADTYNQTSGSPFLRQGISLSTAGAVTASIRLKKSVGDYIQLFVVDTATLSNGFACWINLQTEAVGTAKAVGTGGTFTSATIFDLGSDWHEVRLSGQAGTATNISLGLMITNADNSNTRLNPGSVFIWGAQLELGSTATAYQKVTTQYDVTEAGVASVSYLAFDGVDDFLVTPTITPGIDKAQVFAGVQQLGASGGVGILAEMGNFGNGTFTFHVPLTGTTNFTSRGTIAVGAVSSYSSPSTVVLTGLGDISGDRVTLRSNGSQVAQSTSDQGTGNYLAYPLYIGRRAGTSFPFNGNICSLIVRFGTNLTTDTITSTETWVAGKTGVTI